MKKIIVLVLILSVLSVSAFFVVGALVIGEQENVTFKENVIYGDRAYANGVNVFFRSHYDNHLFWNTSYTIGDESKTETDFEFHYNAFTDPKPRKGRGAILKTDFPHTGSFMMRPPSERPARKRSACRIIMIIIRSDFLRSAFRGSIGWITIMTI